MKVLKIVKWSARITALIISLFGLLFYFGYGNPLPFVNPDYSLIENTWLILFHFVLIGALLRWKYEKIGGYLVIVSIIIVFILGIVTEANFSINMLGFLIPGVLYLIYGYCMKNDL